jgi:cell wall-associated NlpC family hydrolase
MGVNGKALLTAVGGGILLYTGLTDTGGNPRSLLRSLLAGSKPAAPSTAQQQLLTADSAGTGGVQGAAIGAGGSGILAIAAQYKGQCYSYGAGHMSTPCGSSCTDCSSYVSCVLHKAGLLNTTLATGGLAGWGVGVPYAQRAPGDVIVWNGGTGGGHTGIIIDGSTMWNNPCTKCGGVQISHYPYAERTAAAAKIRRAK